MSHSLLENLEGIDGCSPAIRLCGFREEYEPLVERLDKAVSVGGPPLVRLLAGASQISNCVGHVDRSWAETEASALLDYVIMLDAVGKFAQKLRFLCDPLDHPVVENLLGALGGQGGTDHLLVADEARANS